VDTTRGSPPGLTAISGPVGSTGWARTAPAPSAASNPAPSSTAPFQLVFVARTALHLSAADLALELVHPDAFK
jgi:hypothetical protein